MTCPRRAAQGRDRDALARSRLNLNQRDRERRVLHLDDKDLGLVSSGRLKIRDAAFFATFNAAAGTPSRVPVLGSKVIGGSELDEPVQPVGASHEPLVFPVLLGQTLGVSIEFPEIVP